jgi:hypothetical protein
VYRGPGAFRSSWQKDELDDGKIMFQEAKGPDFASRLSGYIELHGLNPRDADDHYYLFQRAIVLRGILRHLSLVRKDEGCLVDQEFIKKLLTIRDLTHGARSLTALVTMCVGKKGEVRIPPISQLKMHMPHDDALQLRPRPK